MSQNLLSTSSPSSSSGTCSPVTPSSSAACQDKYSSFAELKAAESESAFTIEHEIRGHPNLQNPRSLTFPTFLFFAPHGGKIEHHTTEIARQTARICSASFYAFNGHLRSKNRDLHITSTKFDEPILLDLLSKHHVAVSFHGCKNYPLVLEDKTFQQKQLEMKAKVQGDWDPSDATFYVGGLMRDVAKKVVEDFLPSKGFQAVLCEIKFAGKQPENVCNRGIWGRGLQFEMTAKLRQDLVEDWEKMNKFCEVLMMAMEMIRASCRKKEEEIKETRA